MTQKGWRWGNCLMGPGQMFTCFTVHIVERMGKSAHRNQPSSLLPINGEQHYGFTRRPSTKSAALVAHWRCASEIAKTLESVNLQNFDLMIIRFSSFPLKWLIKIFWVSTLVACGSCFSQKDVKEHCLWSDRLLDHYLKTFNDRQVYWTARERAKTHGDLMVLILDSYDKGKVTLPRWPFSRTPKKVCYETIHRWQSAV